MISPQLCAGSRFKNGWKDFRIEPLSHHRLCIASVSTAMKQSLYSSIAGADSDEEPFVKVVPTVSNVGTQPSVLSPHRRVYIYANVFSVSGIDTIAQQFDCHFYVRAMWVEPELKDVEEGPSEPWEPQLVFMNAVSTVELSDPELKVCNWRAGPNGEKVM